MRKLITAIVVVGLFSGIGALPAFAGEAEGGDKPRQEKPERRGDKRPDNAEKREFTPVKGEITAIDGSKITVGEQSFTITDATEIVAGGKAYTEGLKVGQKIGAKVKDGVALRIEVVIKKQPREGDGPRKNPDRVRKEGQVKKEQRD